jgi:hypothetical protein
MGRKQTPNDLQLTCLLPVELSLARKNKLTPNDLQLTCLLPVELSLARKNKPEHGQKLDASMVIAFSVTLAIAYAVLLSSANVEGISTWTKTMQPEQVQAHVILAQRIHPFR